MNEVSTKGMWHLSDKTGKPERCEAEHGGCPYGGDMDSHYRTEEEAQKAYEAKNQEEFGLFQTLSSAQGTHEGMKKSEKSQKMRAETKIITDSFDDFEKDAQRLAYTSGGYSEYSMNKVDDVEFDDDSIRLSMEKPGGVKVIVTGDLDEEGHVKSAYISGYGSLAEEEREIDGDSYTWDFLQTVAENPHDFI